MCVCVWFEACVCVCVHESEKGVLFLSPAHLSFRDILQGWTSQRRKGRRCQTGELPFPRPPLFNFAAGTKRISSGYCRVLFFLPLSICQAFEGKAGFGFAGFVCVKQIEKDRETKREHK